MKQDLFNKVKSYINSCMPTEVDQLHTYFNNSDDFTLHRKKRGVGINHNQDTVTFVDPEEDERNYYWDYLSNNSEFIVRVDKYGIREGLLTPNGKLFLKPIECSETEVPVYRISCK